MKSIDDWVENQCGEAAMMDASGMVPSIKGDRAGGSWVELWGNWLHRVYVPQRTLPLLLGNVGCVYHVHRPHLCGKVLLSIVVRRLGLLVVAVQPLVSVFGP